MLLALHWGINLTRAVLAWYENCPRGNRGKKIPSSRRTLPSGAELWKTFGAELLAARAVQSSHAFENEVFEIEVFEIEPPSSSPLSPCGTVAEPYGRDMIEMPQWFGTSDRAWQSTNLHRQLVMRRASQDFDGMRQKIGHNVERLHGSARAAGKIDDECALINAGHCA